MTAETCGATLLVVGEDDRELVCDLPAGHDGPVHETKDGEAWGDVELPLPPVSE